MTIRDAEPPRVRLRLTCHGLVQGVGFRPGVHRLARSLSLGGWVLNGPGGVVIEVEGPPEPVRTFRNSLPKSLPPLARLDAVEAEQLTPLGESSFEVRASETGRREGALVPADAALCADCRREMDDPSDRRYLYPFTTCTNCGPRFTLVHHLPYDRERTAMACFPLCDACRSEYEDPGDRRFHAEPVCCPTCGPKLWLVRSDDATLAEGPEAVALTRQALGEGRIVAVKGLGGFQLACRADLAEAVATLRLRKKRLRKPFAVMVRDLHTAHLLSRLSPEDERLMASPRCPIVLAPKADGYSLAGEVAPGLTDVGLLLPTGPLHVELFRDAPYDALVMTSGNLSDEPISCGNREALDRLRGLADLFLLHDRDIVRRADDSVVRATPSGPIVIRRARGFVPEPLLLTPPATEPVLALGGHLMVTACLASGEHAFPSQHIGDLDTDAARAFLREAIGGLEEFLEVRPTIVAADLHPDYFTTWLGEELARERGGRLLQFQHHLAHAASVLGEHAAMPEPGESALALILDGTGWGTDGTAWGGEWLLLHGDGRWRRLAHLSALPLVGGEAAVRGPWRIATAALVTGGRADLLSTLPMARALPEETLDTVAQMAHGPWPMATGAGRLFEAAGALLGLCATNDYEGEAAIQLESAAAAAWPAEPWPEVSLVRNPPSATLPSIALLMAAAKRLAEGEIVPEVAAGFHATFCNLAVELTKMVAPKDPTTIALGGGCLANRLLHEGLSSGLTSAGFEVLCASTLPPGDGGLSFGQAVLATAALARCTPWTQE